MYIVGVVGMVKWGNVCEKLPRHSSHNGDMVIFCRGCIVAGELTSFSLQSNPTTPTFHCGMNWIIFSDLVSEVRCDVFFRVLCGHIMCIPPLRLVLNLRHHTQSQSKSAAIQRNIWFRVASMCAMWASICE